MLPEFLENENLRLFESQLSLDSPEEAVKYARVEKALFEMINSAEIEGPLSILKLDEIPLEPFFNSIEDGLTQRITEHLEYEKPIDECIQSELGVPGPCWRYMEKKLNKKIDTITPISVEEQVLKVDEILDQGKAEVIERALFEQIADYENTRMKTALLLPAFFRTFVFRFAKIRSIVVVLLACILTIGGYFIYNDRFKSLPNTLYQAEGLHIDMLKTEIPSTGPIQSEKGGSLTIVNKKGFVELHNGSGVEIIRASEREVRYAAHFADADKQLVGQGNAVFFVNRQKKNQRYIVTTRDYRIEVTGTYFKLRPDIDNHISVAVREGTVRIVFNDGEIRFLKAGQGLAYDLNTNAFATINDGITISRQELEQFPSIQDLHNYQRLSIRSDPFAEVRIDGRFVGTSPLLILQPRGSHTISVRKKGYRTVDTTVILNATDPSFVVCTLDKNPKKHRTDRIKNVLVHRDGEKDGQQENSSKPSSDTLLSTINKENDFQAAESLENKNWRKAWILYRAIFENMQAPRLTREAALFSMARLEADRGSDMTQAREAFLKYLAFFPNGNFVGESWLRLAELEFEHDQNKSIEYYQRYFEKYPHHARVSELQHRVGLMYLQKKKYDEAITMFKRSLSNHQAGDALDRENIKISLYKALKEKNENQIHLLKHTTNTVTP